MVCFAKLTNYSYKKFFLARLCLVFFIFVRLTEAGNGIQWQYAFNRLV